MIGIDKLRSNFFFLARSGTDKVLVCDCSPLFVVKRKEVANLSYCRIQELSLFHTQYASLKLF